MGRQFFGRNLRMIPRTLRTFVDSFTLEIRLWTFSDVSQWPERRKTIQLIIITLASVVPDFDSAIGQLRRSDLAGLVELKSRSAIL